jgi:hypothetical protein
MTRDEKMARKIIKEIIERLTDRYGDPVMAAMQYQEELETNSPNHEKNLAKKLRRYIKRNK